MTTSVTKVYFVLCEKIENRQIFFPGGYKFTTKGIF